MSFFIADAMAQGAGQAQQQGSVTSMIIMLALFGLIFYFMIFRPQNKRMKEHKNLISSLSKGDEVLMQGGLTGKVVKVADDNDFMVLALNESTEITVQKGAVAAVLPKGSIKTL